jgi:hypothetical protein
VAKKRTATGSNRSSTSRISTGGAQGAASSPDTRLVANHDLAGDPFPLKQKRRMKNGMRALKEIKNYQKSTDLLIQKLPFSRLVCVYLSYGLWEPRAGGLRCIPPFTAMVARRCNIRGRQ